MDELLRHCLQELAFDGDLGCSVLRLRDFVRDFYSSRNSICQNLDDSYHVFVWSLVAQQASVRVGVMPNGQTTEIKIPPQPRASRKGKADTPREVPAAATLELIAEANNFPLDELLQVYGDRLRIAVDPEACFVAVTGSHARPAKLTPMVYASLQLIARSRESGISVLELGKMTGYDQKTCFYLVKQLLDLDLIVKLRRGGNSQNFCVHKYFFDRSPLWKNVREEELRAQEEDAEVGKCESDVTGPENGSLQLPHFDPIDTRHLTSLNIMRQRLTKLLKHSLNNTQPYANISVKIGFRPRSRTDRRFFIARLKELINEGTVEKFFMASQNPDTTQNKQLHLRLASSSRAISQTPAEGRAKITDDDEDMMVNLVTEDRPEQVQVKTTLTLHRQIIDLLHESSTTGATLNELCDRLGSFDKRTLELLIARMERQAPPPHLADLSIVQTLETHGRERRYRIFTLNAYSELVTREGFETPSSPYSVEGLSKAGGFAVDQEGDFYESFDDLQAFYKKWSVARLHRPRVSADGSGKASKGTKKVTAGNDGGQARRALKKQWTNPMLPDGTRKRGRPPKNPDAAETRSVKKIKKEPVVTHASGTGANYQPNSADKCESSSGAHRGIKRKRGEAERDGPEGVTITAVREADAQNMPPRGLRETTPKRKRGRPPKQKTMRGIQEREHKANASPLRDEATAHALESTPLQSKEMSAERKGQDLPAPGRLGSDVALLYTPSATSVHLSDTHLPSPSTPQGPSQAVPSTSEDHIIQRVLRESVILPATQPASDGDRLAAQYDSQTFSPPVLAEINARFQPEMLLGPSASFQEESHEVIGQANVGDEVNRVIASLAAQINDSLTSTSPSGSRQGNQLPQVSQLCAHDMPSSVPLCNTFPNPLHVAIISEDESRGSVAENEAQSTAEGPNVIEPGAPAESSNAVHTPSEVDMQKSINSSSTVVSKYKKVYSGEHERKTNLSSMRRETELVQLIENAGGIMNTSTSEFYTAYLDLIEAIVKAGEAASTPVGARIDRRTLNYCLDKLETNGRIKIVSTSIPSVAGGCRNVKLAYLPTLTEERVRDYISELVVPRRQEQTRERAEKEIELDPNSPLGPAHRWLYSNNAHEVYQERWHRNVDRAEQLFSHSDDVIREALLMEKQTLSQLYGYLTGKIARARELHLRTIEYLEHGTVSPFIASSEHRIISWHFFENDISLSTHCACVASSVFREDIRDAASSSEGRAKLVKDISNEWKQVLQVGKARSRDRIFDLLDYLHSLRLVIPLRQSRHVIPPNRQDAKGVPNLMDFEPMPTDWASKAPLIRPEYWQFCIVAPVYLFSLQKDPAPLWKTVPIFTGTAASAYWNELKAVCLHRTHAANVQQGSTASMVLHEPYAGAQRVATALRRSAAWAADYTLSWYQTQYLKRFVDIRNGDTPLETQDPGMSSLKRISHVISAPLSVVCSYFEASRESTLRALDKRQRREAQKDLEKREADMKLLLAQKGLEAIRSRESAWDSMIERVHPGLVKGVAAARLRKLRQSYVRGNVIQDNHQWEIQISDAIKAAEKMRNSRKLFLRAPQLACEGAAPKISNTNWSRLSRAARGKSVETFIDMQKNLTLESGTVENSEIAARKSKKKDKDRKGISDGRMRRQRFQWTVEYDELVRDAYVILRARCRTHFRLEWTALDQVFPSIPRSSVRARLLALKDQPGAEAYLQRLENCWYEHWIRKRGTTELPDPNPRSVTEFDLKIHLEYLRKHVDKNALRVGVSDLGGAEYSPSLVNLEEIVSSWNLKERKPARDPWDFLSNYSIGEETRENLFLEGAFVMNSDCLLDDDTQCDNLNLAESALKMVVGTSDELYNATYAAALLHGIGEEEISKAMDNLLSRNVLSKLVRDPTKLVPGRTVKISEMNQNALSGPLSKDLFLDASQLEESYEVAKDKWWEWPLTSTDGDTAAVLQLFSDHRVEFDVNTSLAQASRPAIDGNSRKVDDDDIELSMQIRLSGAANSKTQEIQDEEASSTEPEDVPGHGETILGEQACCSMRTDGVVDCLSCIEEARMHMITFSDSDKLVLDSIVQLVDAREKHGVRPEELRTIMDTADDQFAGIIHHLRTSRVPPIYLTGYDSTLAVSAKYIGAWTVTLPGGDGPVVKVFPRRWLDIAGGRLAMVWEAGLRAVVGLVHLRPGISQAELRWRLRAVYDRQEVIDLLNHLMSNGTLKKFLGGSWQQEKAVCIDTLSKDEEKTVFWAVREEKSWYSVC